MTVIAVNMVGLKTTAYSQKVVVDDTPPTVPTPHTAPHPQYPSHPTPHTPYPSYPTETRNLVKQKTDSLIHVCFNAMRS